MNDWEMNALHTLALTRGKVETILCPVYTWVGLESTGGEKNRGLHGTGTLLKQHNRYGMGTDQGWHGGEMGGGNRTDIGLGSNV